MKEYHEYKPGIQKQIDKAGGIDNWRELMVARGSKGGKKSGGTNWQRNPKLASQAASKGGSLGRRGWKYQGIINGNHVWVNSSTGVTDTKPVDNY